MIRTTCLRGSHFFSHAYDGLDGHEMREIA